MAELRITVNRNNLGVLSDNVGRRLVPVLRKVAADIEGDAKIRAPFKTGFLRNSIGSRVINQYNAEVTVGAEYAAYLEFGTTRMAARPYFSPAVDAHRDGFVQAIQQVVEQAARDSQAE
jgi:HK97 gp10 family phage protein